MSLTPFHLPRTIYNLPKIKANCFIYQGKKGYTGSIVKRTIKESLGIYYHYGFIYGFDEQNTLWVIEHNVRGVRCITYQDFALSGSVGITYNSNPLLIGGSVLRNAQQFHIMQGKIIVNTLLIIALG